METNINHEFGDGQFRNDTAVGTPPPRESWSVMFEHLYADMTQLYERESLLIRTEVKEKIDEVKTVFSSMVIGGSFLFAGVFAAVSTAIIALDLVLPLWASALIVTILLFAIGGIMVLGAKKKLGANKLVPRKSIDTLGEIKTTFKERMNEFKSYKHH